MSNSHPTYLEQNNIPESYNPLVEEKKIRTFWTDKNAFKKIGVPKQEHYAETNGIINYGIEHGAEFGTLSFHYAPTFCNGLPHSMHLLNGVVKDVLARHAFERKLQVVSQFGWNCHGIAIEHEVNKRLGLIEPEEIEKIGVKTYNNHCRKFVQRQKEEWRNIYRRLGILVDFCNTYSTMSLEYMEGVWGIFKQLFEKGLVYRDTKALPYSTGCWTHLSDFEAEQNLREITEVATTISLNIVGSNVRLLIWTTSPWKLAANAAVCVNPSARYVKVRMTKGSDEYILSKNRLKFVFSNSSTYTVEDEILGEQLQNLKYHPVFDYFAEAKCEKAFQVVGDDFVCDDLGTGIVAVSPYFGENGYRVCRVNGIVLEDDFCPIDAAGRFKEHILELAGLNIEEATEHVINKMRKSEELFDLQDIKRSKPHCWCSHVPLFRKATSTWFMRVENKRKILDNIAQVNWINGNRSQMMKALLKHHNDWACGRKKYWGTPIPIWMSPSGDEIRCVGSVDELLRLTGKKGIPDLHREFVDNLVIASRTPGNPPLRRIPEVFDCWFESAVMPFIQGRSQADFSVEGSDQTFGWFYTTSIIATALSQPQPSKNIFVHGLVQNADGMKLSKRKHNRSEAIFLADKYGADAVRLHLMSSPLLTGHNFIIEEAEVRRMKEQLIDPLYDIFYDTLQLFRPRENASYGVITNCKYCVNIFDQWLLSRMKSLYEFYNAEMNFFRFQSIIQRIIDFLNEFQSWYIPIRHIKVKGVKNKYEGADYRMEYMCFSSIVITLIMLSQFAPFCTEHIYQLLKPLLGCWVQRDFLNQLRLPDMCEAVLRPDLEYAVGRWKMIVEMVRELRKTHLISMGYRIGKLIISHPTERLFEDGQSLTQALKEVVNIHEIEVTNERSEFRATLRANLKDNCSLHEYIGPTKLEEIASAIRQLSDSEIAEACQNGSIDIGGNNIPLKDIEVYYQLDREGETNTAAFSRDDVLVVVQMKRDLDYYEEGTRLELMNSIQKFKKRAKVFPNEPSTLYYSTKDDCLANAFEKYAMEIRKETNSEVRFVANGKKVKSENYKESLDIKGASVSLFLFLPKWD